MSEHLERLIATRKIVLSFKGKAEWEFWYIRRLKDLDATIRKLKALK